MGPSSLLSLSPLKLNAAPSSSSLPLSPMALLSAQARQIGCPPTPRRPMRSPLPGHLLSMSPPARSAATAGRLCLRTYDPSSAGKAFSPLATQAAQDASAAYRRRSMEEAVLVCLFVGGSGDLRVILTDRSSNPTPHSGEVWLPGGIREDRDKDSFATALRHAKAEIGIDPASVDFDYVLRSFTSVHHPGIVVPVIGILSNRDSFAPVLNKDKVDDIFDAPLKMFLKDEYHRLVEHLEGVLSKRDSLAPLLTLDELCDIFENRLNFSRTRIDHQFLERLEGAHSFDCEIQNKKILIWGLTAEILITAAAHIYDILFSKYEIVH